MREEIAKLSDRYDTDRKGILVGTHALSPDPETMALPERITHTREPLRDERILLGFDGNCSSLYISVTDREKRSEAFREFLNGLFHRNFLQFSVGELMVAGIEDSSLAELPLSHLIGSLSDFDPEGDEANLRGLVYEDPAKDQKTASALLGSIVGELNERKTALGGIGTDGSAIEAYNEKNPYNKKPCIMLLINGYPGKMEQSSWNNDRGNLRSILRDGGRYGIYTVIMEDPARESEDETAESRADLCERRIRFSNPAFTLVTASPDSVADVRRRELLALHGGQQ